jgi:acyl carrier protein
MKTTAEILMDVRPDADYSSSSNFIEDGLLDSLDIIRLVTELSANYGISIEGRDIVSSNFVDLVSIENLVQRARPVPDKR